MQQMETENKKRIQPIVLLIDGHCRLCHGVTRFVVKRDRRRRFRFAALQSDVGRYYFAKEGLSLDDLDTFVMVNGDVVYIKSTAALNVFRRLGGLWPVLYGFIMVPRPIRDWVYDRIARGRYRWFGRTEACLLPTAELRERFVDEVPDASRGNSRG